MVDSTNISTLPVDDTATGDKRLTIDAAGNLVLTKQPFEHQITDAEINQNSEAPSLVKGSQLLANDTFDGLSSAVAFVTAYPDKLKALSTVSYRTQAECTTLGIAYPDGGGADYVIVAGGTGTADGGSFINAGSVQLKAFIGDSVNIKMFGALGGTDIKQILEAARNSLPSSGGTVVIPNDGLGDYTTSANIVAGGKPLEWHIARGTDVTGGTLQGKIVERHPNDGRDIQTSHAEDDFSPWSNSLGYVRKTVAKTSVAGGLPFISVVLNDSPSETMSYPTAMTGYARVEEDGNQGFGIFARVDTYAARGAPKNEINVFNLSGVDSSTSTKATGIGGLQTTLQLPTALLLAAGGTGADARDSAIGLAIGSEGGSVMGFKGGICIDPAGCKDYGIAITGGSTRHIRMIDNRDGATVGPTLYLERPSQSPAGGDMLGRVAFLGNDANLAEKQYGQIFGSIVDSAIGAESSKLSFNVLAGGTDQASIELNGFSANNPVSIIVGGALKKIEKGANDSAGTGFSVLRVAN
tara:strand:- start:21833 stop:23404 length:1572 start_codon:yes stop_codon:yes gene_type:complete